MTTITREIKIDASPNEVWATIADFGGVHKYNPGVPKSYSTSSANGGLNATRHCDLLPMGSIEERIVEWNEGSDYKLEIYEGKGTPPFKSAIAQLAIVPNGNGTRVKMTLEYRMKFGPIGALMDAVMVKRQFTKAVPGILAGLKHYVETGELVDNKVRLNLQPVTAVA